ncbi:MAG: tetratricopeptide repeat protein [Jatrophihabitantaceae bacterium]
MTAHLWLSGGRSTQRREAAGEPAGWHSCHRYRHGPFGGLRPVLEQAVPVAWARWPELVTAHHAELTSIVPELAELIGPGPRTLVEITPHEERTRYYGNSWIRGLSHGLVSLLLEHARRSEATEPWTLHFDQAEQADLAEQEFLAILLRRAEPGLLRVVIGTGSEPDCPELRAALARFTAQVVVDTVTEKAETRSRTDLVAAFINSDGASDEPAELAAYLDCEPAARAELHDRRAAELAEQPHWGLRTGAIPYHLERGSDPTGAGRHALREAVEYCLSVGYSTATLDIGLRGRAVSDPELHQLDYGHFTAKAASALVQLQRFSEAELLYRDLMRRYPRPRVHMTCYYALAMLHTRFYTPRDHDRALEAINTARALASMETDPIEGVFFQVYEDNGLALIEMHRGRLEESHRLVDEGIARIDRELPADRYLVHRTQLVHNRARVLVALRRYEEAYRDFSWLIEVDPYYVEYHLDRANLRRKTGDLDGALTDYAQAIEVSSPFSGLFYNRANVYIERGELDSAITDLAFAVEIDPDFIDGWVNLGMCFLDKDEPERAAAIARDGLSYCPDDPELLCLLGLAEDALGRVAAAEAAYDQALAIDAAHAPAYIYRAAVRHQDGRFRLAVEDLNQALALSGDDPDLLLNRGLALHEAGSSEQAVADYDRALALPGADREALLLHRAAAENLPRRGHQLAST